MSFWPRESLSVRVVGLPSDMSAPVGLMMEPRQRVRPACSQSELVPSLVWKEADISEGGRTPQNCHHDEAFRSGRDLLSSPQLFRNPAFNRHAHLAEMAFEEMIPRHKHQLLRFCRLRHHFLQQRVRAIL